MKDVKVGESCWLVVSGVLMEGLLLDLTDEYAVLDDVVIYTDFYRYKASTARVSLDKLDVYGEGVGTHIQKQLPPGVTVKKHD